MNPTPTPPRRKKCGGYSLVEVSLSVLILAVGLCSILAVFPVAISWGGKSMANMTGSQAARSVIAKLQEEYSYSGGVNITSSDNEFHQIIGSQNNGLPVQGAYYCVYKFKTTGTTPKMFKIIMGVYRSLPYEDHPENLSLPYTKNKQFRAESDLLATYVTYIYDAN